MLTAINNEKIVITRDAQKPGIFTCPECGEVVTLRKGRVKIHHFAHRSTTSCGYGKGESELHMDLKMQVYDSLRDHQDVEEVEIEVAVGNIRPDVLATIRGCRVAFEIQISALSIDDLYRRTELYARSGVYVIWLLSVNPKVNTWYRLRRPESWERWIHHSYSGGNRSGEIHFWYGNGLVRPFRYGNYDRGLGMARRAHIVDDFFPIRLPSWTGGGFHYPERRVWRRRMNLK